MTVKRLFALVALVVAAVVAAPSVASASAPIVWSGADELLASAGSATYSRTVALANGDQVVVATSRPSGANTEGLRSLLKPAGSSFDPPVWFVNDPGAVVPERSVDGRTLVAGPRGAGVVAAWNARPDDGATGPRSVGAAVYSGGAWSAPAYFDLPAGMPYVRAGLFAVPDGTVVGSFVAADGSLHLIGFDGTAWSDTTVPGVVADPDDDNPRPTVGVDGSVWIVYPEPTTSPSVVGRVGGSWTAPHVLGLGAPGDYAPYVVTMITDPAGEQQPAVLFGEDLGSDFVVTYARRDGSGGWSETVVPVTVPYSNQLALIGAVDGSVTLAVVGGDATVWVSTTPLNGPWSTPVDVAAGLAIDPNNVGVGVDALGSLVLGLPSPDPAGGSLFVAGVRAGTGAITGPTLLSTSGPGDNQGAVVIALSLGPDGSVPVTWSAFDSDATDAYGLFWMDAEGVFPPGPAPIPVPRPVPPAPVDPTFTG